MKIHLDDNVLVTAGKYRGKTGKVSRVFGKQNSIVVEKINIRTRHIPKKPGQAGQRIQYEAPIDASNVMVICPACEKTTRVGHIFINDRKQRVCKKCKQVLDKEKQKVTKKR